MRIGKVIGRLTLNTAYDALVGGRFVIVAVQDRFALAGGACKTGETLVVYDNLGASEGDTIAFTESREATMPFYPEKKVPIDAFNAAATRIAREAGAAAVDVTGISREAGDAAAMLVDDGLHPSAAQYALWADAILEPARRALGLAAT